MRRHNVRLKAKIGWQPVPDIMELAGVALYCVIGYSSPATSRARMRRVDLGAPFATFDKPTRHRRPGIYHRIPK